MKIPYYFTTSIFNKIQATLIYIAYLDSQHPNTPCYQNFILGAQFSNKEGVTGKLANLKMWSSKH